MSIPIDQLISQFKELEFKPDEPLAPFTHMKVGGPADALVVLRAKQELFEVCSFCFQNSIPFVVIGGASNVIIPDEGLRKLVIVNKSKSIQITELTETTSRVEADSGVITAVLAKETMERGLGGLECFVGVPGTIGGAVVNNSHFSAAELVGNLIESVEVCTTEGKKEVWNQEKLAFDYDYSIFHERKDVVLSAVFVLKKESPQIIQDNMRVAALKRTSTQPIGIPSSGCMYRNPQITRQQFMELNNQVDIPTGAYRERDDGMMQIAAGFLIDRAGLKGKKVGGAQVSEKHATYMINTGSATATDVEELCQNVEAVVKEKYGIKLEREVFFVK